MFDLSILITALLVTVPLSGLLLLPYLIERMTAMKLTPVKVVSSVRAHRGRLK
jgi:hypothetical protein